MPFPALIPENKTFKNTGGGVIDVGGGDNDNRKNKSPWQP